MLVIHIGSPKTGTTAIQGVLKSNADALAERNCRFVQAGRTNIAHNSMVKPLLKGRADDTLSAIREEVARHPAGVHILSSEVFFQPAAAPLLADGLAGMGLPIKVVAYLRRPDHYAEAMYKQKVKNGRIDPDPDRFLEGFQPQLSYGQTLDAYRAAFGQDAMCVRPFERRHLKDDDVVEDFLDLTGGGGIKGLTKPETPSNKTLSRAVSEHLGRVNRSTDFNTRVMIREIAAAGVPDTIRSGDVYDKAARQGIHDATRADQAAIAKTYFADLADPFDWSDLSDTAPDPYPGADETLLLERAASDAVIAAIGRQAAARAAAG
ncbi:MAG: hypothetical protein AAGM21_10840 [Pseudomonadota bacterium]